MPTEKKRPTVLLADDESIVRRLMRTMLIDLNCDVIDEASNGTDAIEKYKALRPDLAFIDINMPDLDGLAVLEAILAHDKHAFAVIVSADSTMENVRKAIQTGAQGFIVKPFTPNKFQDILDKFQGSLHAAASGKPS